MIHRDGGKLYAEIYMSSVTGKIEHTIYCPHPVDVTMEELDRLEEVAAGLYHNIMRAVKSARDWHEGKTNVR